MCVNITQSFICEIFVILLPTPLVDSMPSTSTSTSLSTGLPEQYCCVGVTARGLYRVSHGHVQRTGDVHLPRPPSLCEQGSGASFHLHGNMRG